MFYFQILYYSNNIAYIGYNTVGVVSKRLLLIHICTYTSTHIIVYTLHNYSEVLQ